MRAWFFETQCRLGWELFDGPS